MVSKRKRRIIYLVTKPSWLAYSCNDESERHIADGVDGLHTALVVQILKRSVGARYAYMKEYGRYVLAGRCVEDPEALESIKPGGAAYVLRAPQLCSENSWLVLNTACVYKHSQFRLKREGKRYVVPGELALCAGDQDTITCISNMMSNWLAIMIPKHYEGLEERLGCWRVNKEKKYYKVCWRRIPEDKLAPAP